MSHPNDPAKDPTAPSSTTPLSSGVEPNRREFLRSSALAAGAVLLPTKGATASWRAPLGPGEKLRVAAIGVGGRGGANLNGILALDKDAEIVALCDVDKRRLDDAAKKVQGAKVYRDFRQMLAELKDVDAVTVSTADHTHASATAMALRRGLDVYCEKPLSHTVHEARVVTDLARQHGAITQMGTQIHSWPNFRRVVELVESGSIGDVREVHVFCNKTWSGGERPKATPEVPEWLDWDLWLGPAPERPYHRAYHPAGWRRWWDFGNGTLGDMACHYMDLAYWALDLRHPNTVRAEPGPIHEETTPRDMMVHFEFPARGSRPPVDFTWYDDRRKPERLAELGLEKWGNGVLFVGEKGWVVGDYTKNAIGPAESFKDFTPPKPYIPDSIGHYREWVEGCKHRERTTCDFAYSGPLSEAVLLGAVSYRLGGVKLDWDAKNLVARNEPRAAQLIAKNYRDGWTL